MTATEELRRMLDEQGIEYREYQLNPFEETTAWDLDVSDIRHEVCASFEEFDSGSTLLKFWNCTPEQAVAATLGDTDATPTRQGDAGTCHDIGGCRWFRCSACGFGIDDMYINEEHEYPPANQPRYCPNCGRKVVGA